VHIPTLAHLLPPAAAATHFFPSSSRSFLLPLSNREPPRLGQRCAAVPVRPTLSRELQDLRLIAFSLLIKQIKRGRSESSTRSWSSSPVCAHHRLLQPLHSFPGPSDQPYFFLVRSPPNSPSQPSVSRSVIAVLYAPEGLPP
jgi:hypothetical protein